MLFTVSPYDPTSTWLKLIVKVYQLHSGLIYSRDSGPKVNYQFSQSKLDMELWNNSFIV